MKHTGIYFITTFACILTSILILLILRSELKKDILGMYWIVNCQGSR